MTADRGRDTRDVVPRWRPFLPTVRTGELSDSDRPIERGAVEFRAPNSEAFESHPGLFTAGDLLSQVVASGSDPALAAGAAEFVRAQSDAGPAVLGLANSVLDDDEPVDDAARAAEPFDKTSAILRAREMKRILRAQPRNAVRWTDLALVHANLGQLESAARNMDMAVALAPNNRFVLRSAARLHTLLGEPDRGLAILRAAERIGSDPWLQAAEISLAELADSRSKFIKAAKRLVDDQILPPFHLSELAGELATTEMRHGSNRAAKRLMRTALVDPTENAVAQAEWASQHGMENPDPAALLLPRSFEARAIDLSARGEYVAAVSEALKWQSDQPFDADAGIFVSYTALTLLEQYDVGVFSARQALRANPGNSLLLNNLVFGLASSGRVEEAAKEMVGLPQTGIGGRHEATIQATRGLVAFRSGRPEEGRAYYQSAIEGFQKVGDKDFAAMAAVFLAREELLANPLDAVEALRNGLARAGASDLPEAGVWAVKLAELAKSAGILPQP